MFDKQTAWHTCAAFRTVAPLATILLCSMGCSALGVWWPCRQMMNLLTADQQSRFEAFRRSSLNKRNMKRVRKGRT